MKFRAFAPVVALLMVASSASAQTAEPQVAAIEPPATIEACMGLLGDIGPKVGEAKLTPIEKAELQVKGATMAADCQESKFKEAADTFALITAAIAAKM